MSITKCLILINICMKHSFDFALTTYCQAKCRSCARTNPSTGEQADWLELKHMDLDVFKRVLSQSKNIQYDWIQFCGELGDPMMHPKVEDFIVEANKYVTTMIHVNTNGGLRNPDWYARMARDYPRLRIKFGVDGTDHDTNWLYREGVDWQRAMDNMTAWFTNGGAGAWHFLIFDWNWHQIPEAVDIAKKIGAPLEFKINNRQWGLITEENRKIAWRLLEEHYDKLH